MTIDWSAPIEFWDGTPAKFSHQRSDGSFMVKAKDGLGKHAYQSNGLPVVAGHYRVRNVEKVPPLDMNRRHGFLGSEERAWFSHKIRDTESDAVILVFTDKSANVYTVKENGEPVSGGRWIVNLTTEQEAAAERVKQKREARRREAEAMEQLTDSPAWGMF